jgi:hypothetical protein
MSVVMPTPDPSVVARFVAGDENALVALYRQEYDSLLSAATESLGPELAHYRGRVAHKAMLDTWHARERFQNPVAFSGYLEEAVHWESDNQRRRHAALRHRDEPHARHHLEVATVDDAVKLLMDTLHAPEVDHERAAQEARAMQRAHAKEHVERVAGQPRWLLYGGLTVVVAVAIISVQRMLDRAGSEVAVDRALKSDDVQNLNSGKGQRGALTLRDGTKATLGSETRLTVPDKFPATQRTVQLEGTATFQVTPVNDVDAMPFAVRAGTLTVTAKGTQFTVRHYTEESGIVVHVTEGSVVAHDRAAGATRTVNAGETVRYAGGTFAALDGVARDVAVAWTRDSIVFDQEPLRLVVPELVRWFGINAALVDESAGDRPVSMRIALNSSGEATKALTRAANLVIGFGKDDRIEFRGAPVNAPAKR